MSTSILHISDLHRDPQARLANGPLLESLLETIGRFDQLDPPIAPPNLIVVSGDLVQGVPPEADEAKLVSQYDEAQEFLVQLSDELVAGDRRRVVIVPGNHDVSGSTTLRARIAWGVGPAYGGAPVSISYNTHPRL